MRVFHRTAAGAQIERDGFRDPVVPRLIGGQAFLGVWVADSPLDGNEGASGDDLLAVELPEADLARYELSEDGRGYREWCVPAAVLNRWPREVVNEDDLD